MLILSRTGKGFTLVARCFRFVTTTATLIFREVSANNISCLAIFVCYNSVDDAPRKGRITLATVDFACTAFVQLVWSTVLWFLALELPSDWPVMRASRLSTAFICLLSTLATFYPEAAWWMDTAHTTLPLAHAVLFATQWIRCVHFAGSCLAHTLHLVLLIRKHGLVARCLELTRGKQVQPWIVSWLPLTKWTDPHFTLITLTLATFQIHCTSWRNSGWRSLILILLSIAI